MLYVIRLFGLITMLSGIDCLAETKVLDKKYESSLEQLPVVEMSDELKQRMSEISEAYHSNEFKQQVEGYKDNLKQVFNIEDDKPNNDLLTPKDRPILFISSSIPLDVLRKYANQLHAIDGGTMVLNGFIGGSKKMMPTLKFIASILNEDAECEDPTCKKLNVDVIIDPVLFDHHEITSVPAFTVYKNKTYIERCKGGQAVENAVVIFGDASVRGLALELLVHDKRPTVKRFIKKAGYDR